MTRPVNPATDTPRIDIEINRRDALEVSIYFAGTLPSGLSCEVRRTPDEPGAALASPSVATTTTTATYDGWIVAEVLTEADILTGLSGSSDLTLSKLTLTLP
ncbi:MAG: hypothetical protein WBF53_07045, partial [Litorimonas sp.]